MNFGKALDAIGLTRASQTIGAPGAAIHGGFIQSEEQNAKLTGTQRYITYSDILTNVSIVASAVRCFLNLVSKAGWKVEANPAGGDRAKKVAEQFQKAIESTRTPWRRIVRRTSMYNFYGFSMQEWISIADREGFTRFEDIEARAQSTIEQWKRDDRGEIYEVGQRSPQDGSLIPLPRWKLVYAVDDAINDSPEGFGYLRQIAEPARRLQRYEQLEGYGFEVDLRGMPVARAPLATLDAQVKEGALDAAGRDARVKPLRDFITKHIKSPMLGMMLDSMTYQSTDDAATPSNVKQYDIELLKAGSTSQAEIAATIERLNREIARIIGIEGILLGATGTGSFAMSKEKTANFGLVTSGALQQIAETYERDLIVPFGIMNGYGPELLPKLRTDPVQHREIAELTSALKDMAAAGAVLAPDDPVINAIRDLGGMPRQDLEAASKAAALAAAEKLAGKKDSA